jgi:serine/threonine protein kinase
MDDTSDTFGLVGQTLAGKYRVERVIAKGGFGAVYYARHIELDTPVAIKVLMVPDRFHGESRVEFLEMFKMEARTIAALAHAAIVRVLDFGSARFSSGEESPWMALEWLEGRTLEADLDGRPAGAGRSPREALDLLRPAFDALSCAHAAGIAHRDIKPANLMLVRARRGEPGLRMLDFGIAKVMETDEQAGSGQTATKTALSSYSLYYAAPEQLSHARTGPWTDVHAIALILVELLTGQRAYRASDSVAICSDIMDRERPTPGRFGVPVGPWEEVLGRALSLRPAERYPDSDGFFTELEGSLDAAELAWRSDRPSGSFAQATMPAVEVVRVAPRHGTTSPPVVANTTERPSTRPRWVVPVAVGFGLALLAAGVRTAVRSEASSPVVVAPEPPRVRPVSPAPEPPAAIVAPPTVAVLAASTPPVVAPATLPADPVAHDGSAPGHAARHRWRGREPVAAPRERTATVPTPTPPAPRPTIVIE